MKSIFRASRSSEAIEPNSGNRAATGFDKAMLDVSEDYLDRFGLAKQILTLLTDAPIDWSVRVGLIGQWGEGKTTVAHWVAQQAEAEGHLIVWLSPWDARSIEEMWVRFAFALLEALDARKISIEGLTDVRSSVRLARLRKQLEQVSELSGIPSAGVSLLQGFFSLGARELAGIRRKLGQRRVVVILDDIDRADPALLPQALLTIRAVLDLEGFSFLVPFDEQVVSNALAGTNPALTSGEKFIEKIFDFRVHLPEPTVQQRRDILQRELANCCEFIPKNAVSSIPYEGSITKALPTNPRKIKAIARSMRMFRAEAQRRRSDEIDWRTLLLASMIRLESAEFFSALTGDIRELAPGAFARHATSEEQSADQARLQELAQRCAPSSAGLRARLIALANLWREHGQRASRGALLYSVRLFAQAEKLTWLEFDTALSSWHSNRDLNTILTWLQDQSGRNALPAAAIAREFVGTLLEHYDRQLLLATTKALLEEHEAALEKASSALSLLHQLLERGLPPVVPSLVFESLFERLIEIVLRWSSVNDGGLERSLREREQALLTMAAVAASKQELWEVYERCARQQANAAGSTFPQAAIARTVVACFSARAEGRALETLSIPLGVHHLTSDFKTATRLALLDVDGPLWRSSEGPSPSPVELVLGSAATDPEVQKNALSLLRLLPVGVREWPSQDAELAKKLVKNGRAMKLIWQAATARPLQQKHFGDLLALRDTLLSMGGLVPEHLPVT